MLLDFIQGKWFLEIVRGSALNAVHACRGQKHQRRKKQHQLMEASAEVASSSVNALLTDSDSETEAPEAIAADEAAVARAEDEASSSPAEIDGSDQRPLKSPFEEFAPSKTAAPKPLLPPPQSHRSVRFNGGLQSFSEEPDGIADTCLTRAGCWNPYALICSS